MASNGTVQAETWNPNGLAAVANLPWRGRGSSTIWWRRRKRPMKFDFPTPFGPIGGWEGGGWLKVDGGWWERTPRHSGVPGAPEHGKDAFHRVPDSARNEWDAVERVLACHH